MVGCNKFLASYCVVSGQKVNVAKSSFYMHSRTPANRISTIQSETGFAYKTSPFKYLGVPIYEGRTKRIYFDELVSKVKKKWLVGKTLFSLRVLGLS